MRRDHLLLAVGAEVEDLESDRQRRDALLRNFTVLGEAAAQISPDLKAGIPTFRGAVRPIYATASCTVTGRSI